MRSLAHRIAELEKRAASATCACRSGRLIVLRDGDEIAPAAICTTHSLRVPRLVIDERSAESRANA